MRAEEEEDEEDEEEGEEGDEDEAEEGIEKILTVRVVPKQGGATPGSKDQKEYCTSRLAVLWRSACPC